MKFILDIFRLTNDEYTINLIPSFVFGAIGVIGEAARLIII
jgi:hypothetical protein